MERFDYQKKHKYQITIRTIILLILDIIFVNTSYYLALSLRFDNNIPAEYIKIYTFSSIYITAIMITTFFIFHLYKSLWRYASIDEMLSVVEANIIGTFINFLISLFFKQSLPKSVYLIALLISIALVGGSRFSYRALRRTKQKIVKKNNLTKNVLIIGGGQAGSIVIKEILESPNLNKNIVGVIDDDDRKVGRNIHGITVLGGRDSIIKFTKEFDVDEIIIALPSAPKSEIKEIIEICKETSAKLRILPGVYELIDGKIDIQKIRDVEIEDLLGREPVKINIEEVAHYLKDQIIMITGGGGSIGSELCRQIAKYDPKKLIILDMYENNAYDIQNELKMTYGNELNLETVIANIRDKERIEEIFKKYKPNLVFHAAAYKHVPLMEAHPMEAIRTNVFGTLNLVELADKYNVKKFVLISTDKAVNPTNVMGATKRIAEKIIQSFSKISKTEFAAVRFGNVLGSNGSVIPLFKRQIANGGPITVTHPDIIRYFMTIPEAVQLVLQAGALAKGGEIFVLDMGEPVKIIDLAKDLIKLSGFEPDVDIKIEFTGLRPGEKLYEELLMEEEGLQKTANEKIFIGKPQHISNGELMEQLKKLKEILKTNNIKSLINCIKEIVPTYKKAENVNNLKNKVS
ncbi:NDP-sugar epimerase, includes UDP-GlcNAc-inverting 4,6-dehydratase FlaA1 and capsular polysaccharide biosynthesis protein EpsC [Marinitoga hydrogenitolerans DSM 16785]|uniref:NDP-sugar epimerase, includes UDP-GlcNAc-inverting 4,6-dehydratase FlaA1 and capsular polysaccharide biosynthesis protein EpsC n=1 Tax=Marinitoga hydrogenitolerans (strain DSM 16785 / JCM 12826 / AT1271) TaxID=1122195 RepID=A0A1M4YZ35_MARH1|nr:nucleoside-diphosphate sugar epimerase/dehydratase [Marinitoga hydrogenitolerans]SHF10576.1 NDP-sugar epimerase, includes UDP-GlcNAc-inverting 4,6-dehydratase FlaA1 and capsular polysaccharide biosynthesis protein EpsC [Marinitoga hydrogenitolerans DSM 16785]